MRRHSLLIGVQNYEGSSGLTPLNCPLADIELVKSVAADPRYMGPDPRCFLVPDPTLEDVQRKLAAFLREVGKEDPLLIYFSGHGLRSQRGDLFLCMRDTDEENLELSALNARMIVDVIERRGLRHVLIVFDCCYSGAVGSLLHRDSISSEINGIERVYAEGRGIYVLSSAGAAQTAREGAQYGIFTEHFVNGILTGEADTDHDGRISVAEIAEYLPPRVSQNAPGQTPVLSSHATSGTFIVAFNPAVVAQLAAAEADRLAQESARLAQIENTRRAASWNLTRKRLVAGLLNNHISSAFLAELDSWAAKHAVSTWPSEIFALIEGFGTKQIDTVQFVDKWKSIGSIQTPPVNEATHSPLLPPHLPGHQTQDPPLDPPAPPLETVERGDQTKLLPASDEKKPYHFTHGWPAVRKDSDIDGPSDWDLPPASNSAYIKSDSMDPSDRSPRQSSYFLSRILAAGLVTSAMAAVDIIISVKASSYGWFTIEIFLFIIAPAFAGTFFLTLWRSRIDKLTFSVISVFWAVATVLISIYFIEIYFDIPISSPAELLRELRSRFIFPYSHIELFGPLIAIALGGLLGARFRKKISPKRT